jgi:hypothetical protein
MSAKLPGKKGKDPAKKSFMERYRENLEKERAARERERQKKLKALGPGEEEAGAGEEADETPVAIGAPRKKTREENQAEHLARIYKTLIASVIGIVTGIVSYILVDPGMIAGIQAYTVLAFLIMLAGIVVQRHIFTLLKVGTHPMGAKDWLYQGFMTFAFWFIAWTILLTQGT